MAWQYLFVCLFDFVLAPALQTIFHTGMQWEPLTLQGSGLYHMSMGAVIGAASWTRGVEKITEIKAQVPPTEYEVPPQGSVQ